MSSPAEPPREGVLEAELLRDVLDTVAHDLGGLASALALRADVMPHVAPEVSATACTAIANELRILVAQLREIGGPRGGDTLSPSRAGSLASWFELLSRFAQPLLGRGVALRGEVRAVQVGSTAAHELTYLALAMLHAFRACAASAHTEVRITSDADEHAITISISLRDAAQPLSLACMHDSHWTHWAQRRAASAQIGLHVEETRILLRVARTAPSDERTPVS